MSLPILMYVPAAAAAMSVDRASAGDWLVAAAGACLAMGWRFLPVARGRRTRANEFP